MRTNIVIDDKLMADTLRATGFKTKREAVEMGLKTLLRLEQQIELRELRGKYGKLQQVTLGGETLAIAAAQNFRKLRGVGVTVRGTVDAVIATRCIEDGYALLHSDRDFDGFEKHLGLRVVKCEA